MWRKDGLRAGAVALAVMIGWVGAMSAPAWAQPGDKQGKPDFKPFEEVTKDCQLIDGFVPLYFHAKTDRLLAVIPESLIGSDFLIAQSLSSAGRLTGFQFGHRLVRWQRFNKKLILLAPELRHVRAKQSTVNDVIERTYTDSVILSTPIVALRGKDPVIDLDKVFKRDLAGLKRIFGGRMDNSISRWVKKKVFPNNIELAVEAVYMPPEGEGTKVTIYHSISRLPQTAYRPREADDRIGYFLTARKDWTTSHDDPTVFKRLVHRWHLRKSDPSEAVSDVHPDDQVVFYLEKTVPVKYRRYVREGILMWNHAFEKAGIRDAIQVRQQTETNEFAQLDPEDVNYNFFRWIVSGRSFAMGPSRANPITGQILDADIIMDDSMARVWAARYDRMTAQGPTAHEDPLLNAFFESHPEWRFGGGEWKLAPSLHDAYEEESGWEPEALEAFGMFPAHGSCAYANGVSHEMALGAAVLRAATEPGVGRDEFVGQWIKLVACHEVGHTLGLRHNFRASSWKSLEEILANNDENVPTTASVMDYNPAVYNLDRSNRKLYLSQAVGPYDELAIEYGYRVPMPDEQEGKMLNEIAARVSASGLTFSTDEDTSFLAPDPLVNTYDYGDDPIAWANYRMNLVDALRRDMADWAVEKGESYHRLRQAFDMMLFEYSRVTRYASRVIGGQYLYRDHKGDPDARTPVEIVPAERQRAALAFLTDRVFGSEAFDFDPELLNRLAPGRWRHWGSDAYDRVQEYPLHDRIAAVQYWALFHVTNPATINRVYDAELKVPPDADSFSLAELITDVAGSVWAELKDDRGQRRAPVPSLRRNLQRQHLQMLIQIVLAEPNGPFPADAIAITRSALGDLMMRIDANLSRTNKIDVATRAHLLDSSVRIRKALDAGYQL